MRFGDANGFHIRPCDPSLPVQTTEGDEAMMKVDAGDTALVITDPQNDFLSPKGATWGMEVTVSRKTRLSSTSRRSSRPPKNAG